MNKILWSIPFAIVALVWVIQPGTAQEKIAPKYEYAILKWDGPDRLFYNMPDRFEWVHLQKKGVKIPSDAQEEEWCLAYGVNQVSKEGWEPVDFDSRRVLLRRAK